MHKKLAGLGLAACLVLSQGIYAASPIKILLNGQEIKGDVAPQVKSQRTFVPLRFVSEALGYKVDWFQKDQSVSIAKGQKQIKLLAGEKDPGKPREKIHHGYCPLCQPRKDLCAPALCS